LKWESSLEKLESDELPGSKNAADKSSPFETIPKCERHTDGQTD